MKNFSSMVWFPQLLNAAEILTETQESSLALLLVMPVSTMMCFMSISDLVCLFSSNFWKTQKKKPEPTQQEPWATLLGTLMPFAKTLSGTEPSSNFWMLSPMTKAPHSPLAESLCSQLETCVFTKSADRNSKRWGFALSLIRSLSRFKTVIHKSLSMLPALFKSLTWIQLND